MGNYKNPNAIDVIISGAKTLQGSVVTSAGVTGKYSEFDSCNDLGGSGAYNPNAPGSLNVDATVAGRIYGKYKNTGSTINYYQ